MKEYFGESATFYKQSYGKQFILFPAIKRALPNSGKLLDVGCGNADMASIAKETNLEYYGLDVSTDMLNAAQRNVPEGNFIEASATAFSSKYNIKFDVIVLSMLFPVMSKFQDMVKTLEECHKVLSDEGIILIGVAHPAYDYYMQHGLLQRDNVETDFKGYFDSGEKIRDH